MKKVLSVLLAAAMACGMSVSAFAANNDAADQVWGTAPAEGCVNHIDIEGFEFDEYMNVVRVDGTVIAVKEWTDFVEGFQPGDKLYWALLDAEGEYFQEKPDAHWTINIKANNFVEDAYFVTSDLGYTYVCVEIDDMYDDLDETEIDFYMYIADNKTKNKSAKARVNYDFDNINVKYVDFDFTNDADHVAKWIVKDGQKRDIAVFDFEDNCYYTVKMHSGEEVILNFVSETYVKAIDKAFDYEADYTTYNFKGTQDVFTKAGELFIEADDESFIYEVIDGEFEEVEATYVEDYEVIKGTKVDGWVIETSELGYYVVSDIELEVAEVEVEETETEEVKANPETGASDFVGAAVALAVVSVAAAGALALKK